MKYTILLLVAIFLSGCTFTFKATPGGKTPQYPPSQVKEGSVLVSPDAMTGTTEITNQTEETIFLNFERSSMEFASQSFRVIPGDTRKMFANMAIPSRSIAPESTIKLYLFRSSMEAELIPTDRQVHNEFSNIYTKLRLYFETDGGDPIKVLLGPNRLISKSETILVEKKGDRFLCILTGIFYGGSCWYMGLRDPHPYEITYAQGIAEDRFGQGTTIELVKKEKK